VPRVGGNLSPMEVLDPATVDAALAGGMAWEREGDELVKVYVGRAFADALAYVNAVGALAEEVDHHPDIDIRWNRVTLRLSTHSAGGITSADLDLGRRIDALPTDPA
jgi:4a-hydroxytetrahydrobiopterin dehydratase